VATAVEVEADSPLLPDIQHHCTFYRLRQEEKMNKTEIKKNETNSNN
jgi:hypothetical protein